MKAVSPRVIARGETILKSWLPRTMNRKCSSGQIAVAEYARRSAMYTASNEYSETLSSEKQTYRTFETINRCITFFTMEGKLREY
jgi:hypothetical protein